jgi:hypothetical protein
MRQAQHHPESRSTAGLLRAITNKRVVIGSLLLTLLVVAMVVRTLPRRARVDIKVTKTEPAQIFDDAGAEMVLVTLAFQRPAHEPWISVECHTNVEAQIAGSWKVVGNTLSLGSLGSGETKQEVILMPGNAERCRIHLTCAGASIRWRFGTWLSRRGVKLPPNYWEWAGWPRAEGRNPHWNSFSIEFPLGQAHRDSPKSKG